MLSLLAGRKPRISPDICICTLGCHLFCYHFMKNKYKSKKVALSFSLYFPLQQSWKVYTGYTGFTLSIPASVRPSVGSSVHLSWDGIMFALCLPQHSPHPFHFYTSTNTYQPTSEGVSHIVFFSTTWIFAYFYYLRLLNPLYDLDHPCWPWQPWTLMLTLTCDSTLGLGLCISFTKPGYPTLLYSQADLVVFILIHQFMTLNNNLSVISEVVWLTT